MVFRCVVAALRWEVGREAEAGDLLEALAGEGFAAPPTRREWFFRGRFVCRGVRVTPRSWPCRRSVRALAPICRLQPAQLGRGLHRVYGPLPGPARDHDVALVERRVSLRRRNRDGPKDGRVALAVTRTGGVAWHAARTRRTGRPRLGPRVDGLRTSRLRPVGHAHPCGARVRAARTGHRAARAPLIVRRHRQTRLVRTASPRPCQPRLGRLLLAWSTCSSRSVPSTSSAGPSGRSAAAAWMMAIVSGARP